MRNPFSHWRLFSYSSVSAKGFTLIELLVVIAIVAILAVVVILTLNPAELLKQARDSNRISDIGTLRTAISEYLVDAGGSLGTMGTCYISASTTATITNCGFAGSYAVTSSVSRKVDGTGWIPIPFSSISSGSPIAQEPVDPLNSGMYIYRYVASTGANFKLMAALESAKYTTSTSAAAVDGGSSSTAYEAGSALSL